MKTNLMALSSAIALLAASGIAQAHENNIEVPEGSSSGYILNAEGTVIASSDGCIRHAGWSEDNQINACEGTEEPVAAVEPEPEPVPEPVAPTPEPTVNVVTLGGQALFDTNSDQLNAEGDSALSDLVGRLGDVQEIESMVVTGHTDSRGTEDYNQDLSERRAATVATYLEAALPDTTISSSGAGELSPVDTNDTAEGRQANRRVEIQVTAKSVVPQS